RGADGPAALVISETQRAQIAGLQTAIDNTNQAVSLVQTGEGALNEMNSLLDKVRSLAVNSANSGVNDTNSLQANQDEINNAVSTITQIANNTQFGTKKLLDGSAATTGVVNTGSANLASTNFSSAATGNYTVNVTQQGVEANTTAKTAAATLTADTTLTISGGGAGATGVQVDLKSGDTVDQQMQKMQAALDAGEGAGKYSVSLNSSGKMTITHNQFGATTDGDIAVADSGSATGFAGNGAGGDTHVAGANLQATVTRPDGSVSATLTGSGTAGNTITDSQSGLSLVVANAAGSNTTTVAAASASTLTVSGGALTFQIGANAGQTVSLSIDQMTADHLGTSATGLTNSATTDLSKISVMTSNDSQDAIKVIDSAISQVTALRGKLGAFQANTLQSNVNNLQTSLQNTTAAESTIRDTDFASEIANYTKLQTQEQAGATVLGNANQMTSLVAQLLRG
ncbi:MAG TPA: flagellin, partial [Urbifossiella sp.]|nr:flagellin [Urbifossiella sp.]